MKKQTLVWRPKWLMSGKFADDLWKIWGKAKSKKELHDAVLTLAYQVQDLESRLNELKKHVGEKTVY